MSFSQQNAWMRVKWICRATSLSSSSSAASRHSTTLSGSLGAGGSGECTRSRERGVEAAGGREAGVTYTLSSLAASYTPTVMVRWLRALLSTSSRASPTVSILQTDGARAGQSGPRPREGQRPPSPQAHLPFGLLLCRREFLQSHIASASPSRGAWAAPAPPVRGAGSALAPTRPPRSLSHRS